MTKNSQKKTYSCPMHPEIRQENPGNCVHFGDGPRPYLAGHNRYAHITSLMGESVNTQLLGMTKVVSDDSARRALWKIDEEEGIHCLP